MPTASLQSGRPETLAIALVLAADVLGLSGG
jgi:hypothetical protein